jgi:uncharacterized protein YbcI
MKKIISVTSLCLALGLMVLISNKHEAGELGPALFLRKSDPVKKIDVTNEVTPSTDLVIETEEAPFVEDIEKEFISMSNKEIREEIIRNEAIAKEQSFIAKANADELDQKSAARFVKYIRTNGVLHKILLDRQLEDIETEKI